MAFIRMTDLDLSGKRVLIREDLNVPIQDGTITSTQRLDAALPTIRRARDADAAVLVMSHLGRPKEGVFDEAQSLKPVQNGSRRNWAPTCPCSTITSMASP